MAAQLWHLDLGSGLPEFSRPLRRDRHLDPDREPTPAPRRALRRHLERGSMHVALSHKRNLFHLGGLFPDEAQLFRDVRAAMQDPTVPLTPAKALIGAEETVAAVLDKANVRHRPIDIVGSKNSSTVDSLPPPAHSGSLISRSRSAFSRMKPSASFWS